MVGEPLRKNHQMHELRSAWNDERKVQQGRRDRGPKARLTHNDKGVRVARDNLSGENCNSDGQNSDIDSLNRDNPIEDRDDLNRDGHSRNVGDHNADNQNVRFPHLQHEFRGGKRA